MRLDYLPTLSILDLPPTFPNRSALGDFYLLNVSNMHSMQPDLLYLTLCMLINLISVPPYARKANATPSMQPPRLPTYLPTNFTLPQSFFQPTKSLHLAKPSKLRAACIRGSRLLHPFLLPPYLINKQEKKTKLILHRETYIAHPISSHLHAPSHTTPYQRP